MTSVDARETPALRLESVRAAYDQVEVLHGLDLTVRPREVFAVLGPNGAGKTTLLKVASGQLAPSAGRVLIDGRDVTGKPAEQLSRQGVCTVPEGRGVFPHLTIAENLAMWTYRGGLSRSQVEEAAFSRFPVLAERRRQVAGTLSGGEQQMLAVSRALATSPSLLLLDELSMGLAPKAVAQIYEVIAEIAAAGPAILVVEQFAATALAVATRAAVMVSGRVEAEGSPAEIAGAAGSIYLAGSAARSTAASNPQTPTKRSESTA